MNRKGSLAIFGVLITAVVAIVFITNLLIPQVKGSTQSIAATDSLAYANTSVSQNFTMTNAASTLEAGTFSIDGLTATTNYTFSYVTGKALILNGTTVGTYTAHYNYYGSAYFTNTAERALFAVIVLAAILGIIIFLFNGFGLTRE
jgi:hypothetical protein